MKVHTRGLLYVGLADINKGSSYGTEFCIEEAFVSAEILESEGKDLLQAIRIFRKCADIVGDTSFGKICREKAKKLASVHGAKDQILKAGV